MRALVVLVSCMALAACASIPLGTLWQLRGFDVADLAALAPEQVRVAVRVDAPASGMRVKDTQLMLELSPREGGASERHAFTLRTAAVSDAMLTPPGGRPWQVFELDQAGLRAMRKIQPGLVNVRERYGGASFSVNADFDGTSPPGTREFVFSVRLRLSDARKPFTLFDRAKMPVAYD